MSDNIKKGLTSAQAERSRQQHGPNIVTPAKKDPVWKLLLEKFKDPIIEILLVAALLSFLIAAVEGEYIETIGIVAAILLATCVGFFFEWDAGKKFDLLNRVNDDTPVKVYRDGKVHEIPKRDVVVGDVVVLAQGDEIPADGRLSEAVSLQVNESCLTGEPVISKSTYPEDFDTEATYPTDMAMRGTTVTDGHGEMTVTAVGDETEFGRVAQQSTARNEQQTPLNRQLEGLAKFISVMGFAFAFLIFAILFVKDIFFGVQDFDTLQLVSLGAIVLALLVLGFKMWVPVIYNVIALKNKNVSTPRWIRKSPWWAWVLGAAGVMVVFAGAEYAFGINPMDDENWIPLGILARILGYMMVAVTLIVVVVPEGLPMSVTLSLALSMRRMLKSNNLVRKMHACETMGAITVICTDKTGTLTQNRMQVYETDFGPHKGGSADGGGMQEIINTGIAVNSTAFLDVDSSGVVHTIGNPTEAALLLWLRGQGQDYEKLRESVETVSQLTFSTERKYMGTLIKDGGGKSLLFIKGAPEIVLSKCSLAAMPEGDVPVADIEADVRATLSRYQDMAMRTLGFAYAETDPADAETPVEKLAERGLVFLGVAAISDPVREDVGQAVAECRSAGIAVKIVTGDTPATAREIARQIGLWDDTSDAAENIITGPEFASLTDEEAIARVQALKIMARARPMDKQRLVQLLQKKGEVVAVTGDGTNDAPALNFADVGLSMGTGTSVAKEASDITIIDDSFASIATAVMWGRSLYKNIQRFIVFQLTINLVALLIVFLGSAFGTEMPLSVTQMLWVNLIMDTLAAGALASLPPDRRVMDDAPRDASAFIITHSMKRSIFVTGILSAAGLLGVLWWFYHTQGGVSRAELSMFFTLFVMMQVWNLMNVKAFASGRSAFAGMGQSLTFVLVLLAIVAGQVLIVTYGGDVFRTEALSMEQWIWVLGGSSVVLWAGEAVRLFTGKKTVKKYKA